MAGIPEKLINEYLYVLNKREVNLHSLLLQRGNDLVFERYWAPYDEKQTHRMYSTTKSFVSIAIGCLMDEGKLHMEDKIIDFFPDKLPEKVPDLLAEQTIHDMLTMQTCFAHGNWFQPGVTDRTAWYFSQTPDKPADTLFWYDSTGSYILGVLVERLSGMSLLDYLKVKILNKLGGFEDAHILSTPDGTPWGDSALLCTPRALMNFARFVMNYGTWNGERLLSEQYLREATTKQADNNLEGSATHKMYGYGYQIWIAEQNSFFFSGMGSQFVIGVPDKDLILVCTGDTQMSSAICYDVIFDAFFEQIVNRLEGEPCHRDLLNDESYYRLQVAHGEPASSWEEQVNGKEFICRPNRMGITKFHLELGEKECAFCYTNVQGDKVLRFGRKENIIQGFPERGYSDEYGNVHEETGFMYRCAVSGGWVQERKLQLRVQVIDRYFGILSITIGFTKDGKAGVSMQKVAEDFFRTYEGFLIAE